MRYIALICLVPFLVGIIMNVLGNIFGPAVILVLNLVFMVAWGLTAHWLRKKSKAVVRWVQWFPLGVLALLGLQCLCGGLWPVIGYLCRCYFVPVREIASIFLYVESWRNSFMGIEYVAFLLMDFAIWIGCLFYRKK